MISIEVINKLESVIYDKIPQAHSQLCCNLLHCIYDIKAENRKILC